jgi:hypothetical protein
VGIIFVREDVMKVHGSSYLVNSLSVEQKIVYSISSRVGCYIDTVDSVVGGTS